MKNILYIFLLVSSTLFLGSCSNDKDNDGPEIEIIKPDENEVVLTGTNLNMKFRFKDEYGIYNFVYQIYHEDSEIEGRFTYSTEIIFNEIVTSFETSRTVLIPLMKSETIPTAPGNYILRVISTDIYNNRTIAERKFIVQQSVEKE